MEYGAFLEYIEKNILQYLEEDSYNLNIQEIIKNNNLKFDGLFVKKLEEEYIPTIYLGEYYYEYKSCGDIDGIMKKIAQEFKKANDNKLDFEKEKLYHFETIKEQIIIRIVNYEKNKEILEECPYLKVNDLAITFRWLALQDEIGIGTALITNKELKEWRIEKGDILDIAIKNTQKIFPAMFVKMENILSEVKELKEQGEPIHQLYVLSNKQGINGAACLFYPNILDDFSKKIKNDFYILPSSIHEVILVPNDKDIDKQSLYEIVKEANQTVVSLGEILSDNVYFYNQKTSQFIIA